MSTLRMMIRATPLLVALSPALAALAPLPPANNGIFEGQAALIVESAGKDQYKVLDVYKGELKPGDLIVVPDITFQKFQDERYSPATITASTRILMFLVKDPTKPQWTLTRPSAYMLVDDQTQVETLKKAARDAVALHADWEKARDIKDPQERAKALFPFLWRGGSACFVQTKDELAKVGAVAGDFLAGKFDELPKDQQDTILPSLGQFGGDKLNKVARKYLLQRWETCRSSLSADKPVKETWSKLPAPVKEAYKGLYPGVLGLGGFKKADDLPLIREIGEWAADCQSDQLCEAALVALGQTPSPDNLQAIDRIRDKMGNDLRVRSWLLSALRAHKYPQTVPVLAKLLDTDRPLMRENVRAALKSIVGQDLGESRKPWLEWYEQHKNTTTAPTTMPATKSAG